MERNLSKPSGSAGAEDRVFGAGPFAPHAGGAPAGFPTELARTYGDLACVRMGPQRLYFVNHPAFVREVLVTQGKSFRKLPRIVRAFRSVDGNGLVSAGRFLAQQRRLVQPAFSPKRFDRYAKGRRLHAGDGRSACRETSKFPPRCAAGFTDDLARTLFEPR